MENNLAAFQLYFDPVRACDFDATPAFCCRVSLKRTKSLKKGGDYCDLKYCWNDGLVFLFLVGLSF
jgi:hypothetical protein